MLTCNNETLNISVMICTRKSVRYSVVLVLLTFILSAAFVFPRQVKAALVFEENFEGNLSSWNVQNPDPCRIETQVSTLASPQGGKNLLLYRPPNTPNGSACYLETTLGSALTKGKVSFYFYDNLDPNNAMNTIAAVKSSTGQAIWLGVRSLEDTQNYTYRVDWADYNTNIPRTFGWHEFTFYKFQDYVFAAIDGNVLKKISFTNNFKDIYQVKFAAGWNTVGASRFDGVKVWDDIPEDISSSVQLLSENQTGEQKTLTFQSRIKSLTGQNYFKNVFFSMSDAWPQVINTDNTPIYGAINIDGQWRFYGLRWIGSPPIITDPVVNALSSYRWDVGGFVSGSNNLVCSNTDRKSSTTIQTNTYACLDISGSNVSYSNSTNELIINWKVVIPNISMYLPLRNIRHNFPLRSTQSRYYSPYINVDHPLSDFQQVTSPQAAVNIRNSWENPSNLYLYLYNEALPDYKGTAELTTDIRNENHSMIEMKIHHPTNASNINEVYFWADELDPNALRSDVAIPFVVKKENGQWKFYGRRYIGPTNTCYNEPFDYTAEDCYKNYVYDVGGFTPGTNQKIYHHLDRNAKLTPQQDVLSMLNVHNSSVTQNGNALTIMWDVTAFDRNGFRHMGVFTRWVDSFVSTNWLEVGRWNTTTTPMFYGQNVRILPKPDNSGYMFEDGTPYLKLGLSKFSIYRVLHPYELSAYLAKMQIYGMDHIRVFINAHNPVPQTIKTFLDIANSHGVYVTLGIGDCEKISSGDFDRRKGYRIGEWMSNTFGNYPSWFEWEACNDVDPGLYPQQLNWIKDVLTYYRTLEPEKLFTVQTHTPDNLGMAKFGDLKNYVDDYSFRTFSANSSQTASDYNNHYNNSDSIIPSRPLYYGEGRVKPYYSFLVDQNQEASTQEVFSQSAQRNLSAVNLAVVLYRPEYDNGAENKQPELSPAEWKMYLDHAKLFKDFPDESGQNTQRQTGDANLDGLTNVIDYQIWLNEFESGFVQQADFNSDGVVGGIDYVIWLTNTTEANIF